MKDPLEGTGPLKLTGWMLPSTLTLYTGRAGVSGVGGPASLGDLGSEGKL